MYRGKFLVMTLLSLLLISVAAPAAGAKEECRNWGGMFTVEFPAGFWTPGTHTYQYRWDGGITDEWTFTVDEAAPLYKGQVILRIARLLADGGERVAVINPAQDTVAWVGLVTELTNRAEAAADYDMWNIEMRIDGGEWTPMKKHPITKMCYPPGPKAFYQRSYGAPVKVD